MVPTPIHISLAAFPARDYRSAMGSSRGARDPVLGAIIPSQAQLCPQNMGTLTEEISSALREEFPETRFRPHANIRAEGWSPHIAASNYPRFKGYYDELKKICAALHSPAYTWHAGYRQEADFRKIERYTLEIEDRL